MVMMGDCEDILTSDTSSQKALTIAMLEAERARASHSVHKLSSPTFPSHILHDNNGLDHKWLFGCHNPLSLGSKLTNDHRGNTGNKIFKLVVEIKLVKFNYGDLWGRVTSLQKQKFVDRWIFSEMLDKGMSALVKTTWGPLLGYTPIVS